VKITSLKATPDDERIVDAAFEILELPWESVSGGRGSIALHLEEPDPDADVGGLAIMYSARCWKTIVAFRQPEHVAHEIFHALTSSGDHVCTYPSCSDELVENLMVTGPIPTLGSELTSSQRDDLEDGYRRFTRCRESD